MTPRSTTAVISLAMTSGSILVAGGAFLCLTEPSEAERTERSAPVEWSVVRDDPSRKLRISWMGIAAHPGGRSGSWIQRNLEETFNITLRPHYLDWNSFKRRRPLMLASGEVPDVMWDGDPLEVRMNVRNNFVMEIPYEVILEHAPTYVEHLNRHGKEAWLYALCKGRNYGLPTFNATATGPRISTWRADWLRNVGIERVPETIVEMEKALRRFRHDDPDGNGRKDTYGWSPYVGHWSLAYIEVFAAFDNLPFDFIARGDRVVWGGVQPECREALAVLRRWYKDELLDPDFIVDSQSRSMETKFANGRTGYLHPIDTWEYYNLEDTGSLASKLAKLCPGGEMVPGPPLRNSAGRRVGRTWGGAAHVLQFGAHLCREPEKVIRVLRMIEAITKDEKLYVETLSGKEGLHWEIAPGKGIQLLEPYRSSKLAMQRELLGQSGFSSIFYYPSMLPSRYQERYERDERKRFSRAFKKSAWAIMNPLGKSDILPSASRYLKDLRDWQQQVYAKIIAGELPLDYFDNFAADWHARGGETLTREANEVYATMNRIYKTVGADRHE